MTRAQAIALEYGLIGFLAVWGTVLVPQLLLQHARYGRVRPRGLIVSGLVTLYACLAVAVVLLPLPGPGTSPLPQPVQLVPLRWVADVAREAGRYGDPLATSALQQLAMNVLLFVPLGIIARTLLRRGARGTLLLGFAASLAIEVTQLTGNFGMVRPYRIFDVDDLMSNTTGALLGWVLATLYLLLRRGASTARDVSARDTVPVPTAVAAPRRVGPTVPAYAAPLAARPAGPPARPWPPRR
ncbi:Glycopeptide antibiotics resistance protein [Amycolatopsis arida]|uniref:Glycopeptide antibiotics resistance protein n=2 Tax=Amycolatopsis arida TaxID=587909 RepID=A0A1I5TJT8_9PSEU|nr:VanZ family protein [Amycolatopsis arida]TDX96068.1 glycopeptide antibiotics resistance protein [Amycolatopsis arida]SFP83334.1 Glycopeptide antibiotics resistance protein [Amycolatopsis arida]